MEWNQLTSAEQLTVIKEKSAQKPQVIFKHSTRCSISSVAWQRLQKGALPDGADFYFLDLLKYRPLSNAVADEFGVHHESPQVLVVKEGKCIYDESHMSISLNDVIENAGISS